MSRSKESKREGSEFLDKPVRDEWGFFNQTTKARHLHQKCIVRVSRGHQDHIRFQYENTLRKARGIHGMSGAGKSTLIKLLMGLYQPWEGEIKWNDVNLMRSRPRVVLQIGDRLRSTGTGAVHGRTHCGPLAHRGRPEVGSHVGWTEAEGGTGLRAFRGNPWCCSWTNRPVTKTKRKY